MGRGLQPAGRESVDVIEPTRENLGACGCSELATVPEPIATPVERASKKSLIRWRLNEVLAELTGDARALAACSSRTVSARAELLFAKCISASGRAMLDFVTPYDFT
jgi:hypothetical protein